jgi:PhnB protein
MSTTGTVTPGTTATTTIQPYIFFYGRCKEALDFYKDVFRGTYEAMTVGDSPFKDNPEMGGDNNRIMHASFTSPGVNFLCSDGKDNKPVDADEGNVSLALSVTDKAEGERIVAALSKGGTVKMPLADAFWGGRFANVVDRFGNDWMITTP